jgi:hypothetical protein
MHQLGHAPGPQRPREPPTRSVVGPLVRPLRTVRVPDIFLTLSAVLQGWAPAARRVVVLSVNIPSMIHDSRRDY